MKNVNLTSEKQAKFQNIIEQAVKMDQIRKDTYLMGFAGPAAQTLRQDFIQYLTNERPAKANTGIHKLIELINLKINQSNKIESMAKYTLKGLQTTATEMNKVLELSPRIEVGEDVAQLIKDITEAKALLEEDDDISTASMAYINVIENTAVKAIEVPKVKAEAKAQKSGVKKGVARLKFYAPLIKIRKFTKSELLEKGIQEFEWETKSGASTFLSDCKNPKYNKLDFDVIVDEKTKIWSSAKK